MELLGFPPEWRARGSELGVGGSHDHARKVRKSRSIEVQFIQCVIFNNARESDSYLFSKRDRFLGWVRPQPPLCDIITGGLYTL